MSAYDEKLYNMPPIEKDINFNWTDQITDDALNPVTGLTGATLECIVYVNEGGPVLQDLSTYFSLTPATATITCAMLPAVTKAITWKRGFYILKLVISSTSKVGLLHGEWQVK